MDTAPNIDIRKVSKAYGTHGREINALVEATCTFLAGSFTTVMGHNGAGKSTLLGTISGSVTPDAGTVTFDDVDVTAMPVHKRAMWVSTLKQEPSAGVVFDLTVLENLSLADHHGRAGLFRSLTTARMKDLARDTLASFNMGLESRLDSYPAELSAGQLQTLAACMVLASSPSVVLLDEPTASLSPQASMAILDAFCVQRFHAHNPTTVLVTHSTDIAYHVPGDLVIMGAGSIAKIIPSEAKRSMKVDSLRQLLREVERHQVYDWTPPSAGASVLRTTN